MAALAAHDFPGNVRKLKNSIERALIESGGADIRALHLILGPSRRHGAGGLSQPGVAGTAKPLSPPGAVGVSTDAAELPLNLEAAENLLIKRALAETGGNIAEAARRLGINRTRIYRKLGERTT